MKRELIEEYEYEGINYCIYKDYTDESVEFQVYKNDIPVSIIIKASYQKIADYEHSGLPELTTEICKILKFDIDRGFITKAT